MKDERSKKVKEEDHPSQLPLTAHTALGGESQDYRGGNLRSDIWGVAYVADILFQRILKCVGSQLRTFAVNVFSLSAFGR